MLKTGPFVFRLFSVLMLLTLLVSAPGVTPAHAAGIRYATAGGTGDCSSWANACTLRIALTGATSGDEIWAAAGTHTPGTTRTDTFQLKSGVAVYGGFAGMETARSGRNPNPATNATLLSGEIGVAGNSDNSYHVVTGATGASLDGFTITAGNANGTSPTNNKGGGMDNYWCSPTLTNVTFSGNTATDYGGGMFNANSKATLTNVTFSGNSAQWSGGMENFNGSSPTLTNVTFSGNTVTVAGGGMRNIVNSSPTLTNVTFSGNSAQWGGGMYNWNSSSPTMTNVTFSDNSATIYGGGMYNETSISPQIRNTIFWGNTAPSGAQIYNNSSTASVSDSVVQGGYAGGTNIITADPLLGTLGDYGGFTQTIPLLLGSSAIDTGNDATCATTDQRGVSRPQGAHCDIGAYEYGAIEPPPQIFTDVPVTYWAWSWIERLYNSGITGGCSTSPLMYCPENSVTRAQMAIFLERGMNGSSYTPPPATGTVFTDVPISYPTAAWIEKLAADGITGGCGGSNYCPDNNVTRAQMAIFLLRAEHGAMYSPPAATGIFADVPTSDPTAAWIEQLYNEHISGGCSTTAPLMYCPGNPVTRASMAVFLVRTFNLP